jgi:hypothetical protein
VIDLDRPWCHTLWHISLISHTCAPSFAGLNKLPVGRKYDVLYGTFIPCQTMPAPCRTPQLMGAFGMLCSKTDEVLSGAVRSTNPPIQPRAVNSPTGKPTERLLARVGIPAIMTPEDISFQGESEFAWRSALLGPWPISGVHRGRHSEMSLARASRSFGGGPSLLPSGA